MVRNIRIEDYIDAPRPLIALGNDYRDGHFVEPHHHSRGQLLYGYSGVVMVTTPTGTFVMPPQRGMWIPAGVIHSVRMLGAVTIRSLYVDPRCVEGMPEHCQVVEITPLLRQLVTEAVDISVEYDVSGRDGALMALIAHELVRLQPLPLSLPLPADQALAKRCRAFLMSPTTHDTIDAWSQSLNMSRRAFTRLFRQETGLSFVEWKQQACLVAALPRLVAGDPVTAIALDLGYKNPAAFTSMFKRSFGYSPREIRRDRT
ncbi:AraC family transcriptional regulator [Neorhizobium sp. P12A]|uniref:AraC family transcriptional regulator n=1 Tax=Rhizobium/Agrobacterium group TaxID=227290 RepID=UPI00104A1DEE|nr:MULTISPECIES: helix-turn-helix transcriptional regulator [Rhizobium/Agrobacterium group]KAA0695718.1 AraC family transcriptional regulator [Neorhizobium sp. P12A]TCR80144.1 AraC family transcriptional regulator [Rhizobium sp. BK376]